MMDINLKEIENVKHHLACKSEIKDLRYLRYFSGFKVTTSQIGIFCVTRELWGFFERCRYSGSQASWNVQGYELRTLDSIRDGDS